MGWMVIHFVHLHSWQSCTPTLFLFVGFSLHYSLPRAPPSLLISAPLFSLHTALYFDNSTPLCVFFGPILLLCYVYWMFTSLVFYYICLCLLITPLLFTLCTPYHWSPFVECTPLFTIHTPPSRFTSLSALTRCTPTFNNHTSFTSCTPHITYTRSYFCSPLLSFLIKFLFLFFIFFIFVFFSLLFFFTKIWKNVFFLLWCLSTAHVVWHFFPNNSKIPKIIFFLF